MLTKFLPDVYIYTDHFKGVDSGLSPGYGLSLVAETTTGCTLSVEGTAQARRTEKEETTEERDEGLDQLLGVSLSKANADTENERPIRPEELGQVS